MICSNKNYWPPSLQHRGHKVIPIIDSENVKHRPPGSVIQVVFFHQSAYLCSIQTSKFLGQYRSVSSNPTVTVAMGNQVRFTLLHKIIIAMVTRQTRHLTANQKRVKFCKKIFSLFDRKVESLMIVDKWWQDNTNKILWSSKNSLTCHHFDRLYSNICNQLSEFFFVTTDS